MKDKEKQRELIVEIMKADEQSGLYDESARKQTAVDWLFKELWDRPKDKMVWYYILEKAKKMEKEKIQEAFTEGCFTESWALKSSEQYYKETYE